MTPKILGGALKVHPAGVMIAAFVGVSILGVVGVVLAAPVLATLILIGRYSVRKLFDLDPWTGIKLAPSDSKLTTVNFRFKEFIERIKSKTKSKASNNKSK